MLIRVFLLCIPVFMVFFFLRNWASTNMRAGKRVLFMLFVILNILAVLRPDLTTSVANVMGVGRGTDLILYILVGAFIFATLNFYLRSRALEDRVVQLARVIALREAEPPHARANRIEIALTATPTNGEP
jgi:small membrane protein